MARFMIKAELVFEVPVLVDAEDERAAHDKVIEKLSGFGLVRVGKVYVRSAGSRKERKKG